MTLSLNELYAIAEIIARRINSITNESVDMGKLLSAIQHNENLNQFSLPEEYDLNHFLNVVAKARRENIISWHQKIILSRDKQSIINSFIMTHTMEEQMQMQEILKRSNFALSDVFSNQMNEQVNIEQEKQVKKISK